MEYYSDYRKKAVHAIHEVVRKCGYSTPVKLSKVLEYVIFWVAISKRVRSSIEPSDAIRDYYDLVLEKVLVNVSNEKVRQMIDVDKKLVDFVFKGIHELDGVRK